MIQTHWVQIPWWLIRKIFKLSLFTLAGAVLAAAIVFVLYLRSLPELSSWHTTVLKNEFTADSHVKDFEQYLALEEKLFNELDEKIYKQILATEQNRINRYTRNSFSDPDRWQTPWNRSLELPAEHAKIGVLMLHGMSDSPYSLNAQARYLNEKGAWVLSMRMPGHGTIPSGLVELKWQDMAAAVKIGMNHLKKKMGNKPIYIMGYSTGAPLALNYTLSSLTDSDFTTPDGLIFYSPAIGVTKAASMAVWQGRLGHLLGIEKLAWNGIIPEYDPFKYGSFAVNAGDQVYRLSNEVQRQFDQVKSDNTKLNMFPPVLSFTSIVDATISVPAVLNKLYNRLPKNNHSLVLFDLNNHYALDHLLNKQTQSQIASIINSKKSTNYTLDFITNAIDQTDNTLVQSSISNTGTQHQRLNYQWPDDTYSLSHLAMPISPNDPLYGQKSNRISHKINLGELAVHGERNVLQIPASDLLRQRWNPFHDYTKQKVLEFLQLP